MNPEYPIPQFCKYCHQSISVDDFFCPSCGKKIKEEKLVASFWSVAWLMVLSAILPPLGIGLTIKYIKSEDEKTRTIGWISLVITLVSLILGVVASKYFLDSINKEINTQLQDFTF